jgi:hypothetical protein
MKPVKMCRDVSAILILAILILAILILQFQIEPDIVVQLILPGPHLYPHFFAGSLLCPVFQDRRQSIAWHQLMT